MLKHLFVCLSFCMSTYFAPSALYLELKTKKQMSEILIPPNTPVPTTAAARARFKPPLRIPFSVFHTDTNDVLKPLVFRNPKGDASNTGEIYLTDLEQSGTIELDIMANPPKIILKFNESNKELEAIFVSSELKAAEVPATIEGISLQINEFYKDTPDAKNKIKDVWMSIQSKINSSGFGLVGKDLKKKLEKKIGTL